jgi:hypothetical protein
MRLYITKVLHTPTNTIAFEVLDDMYYKSYGVYKHLWQAEIIVRTISASDIDVGSKNQ